MHITTWILVIRDPQGYIRLARCRRGGGGLPFSFDYRNAMAMFDNSEARVSCRENDDILLLKGELDISDVQQNHRFLNTVRNRLEQIEDFTGWQQVGCRRPAGKLLVNYRRWMSHRLVRNRIEPATTLVASENLACSR